MYCNVIQRFHACWGATALCLFALLCEVAAGQSDSSAHAIAHKTDRSWQNGDAGLDHRINALIAKMTLTEKVGQLRLMNSAGANATGPDGKRAQSEALDDLISRGQVGSILNEVDPSMIKRRQNLAVHESRLGIPLIFGRDVIHGFRTIFPIPLGQAASWNVDLVEKAAAVAAHEARSVGIHWTFAPMVDLARDPRWGRIAESPGEDPYLASALSAAMVRGFQGDDLSSPNRVAACAKHFAAYGAAEGGRDYNSADVSPSLLRNFYLRPFHAAVESGVATLMTSFNSVNGVPGSANSRLLRDVLRKEWKFRGFVVSDWESIAEMTKHGYARDDSEAALAAVRAGVNVEMVSGTYQDHLAKLVRQGAVSETTIDELVAEVLRVKFRLGLMEQPFVDNSRLPLSAEDHLRLAHQLARQSIVMLENHDRLLPLDRSRIKTLAVIGPLADSKRAQLGTWIPDGNAADSRTPLAAIRESAGPDIDVLYSSGLADDLDDSTAQFDAAVAIARKADVVILIVGEGANLSGEARSRANLDLPGAQNELVDAIAGIGKPIVMIVQAGRPLTIGRQIEKVDAVLFSFHAGTMTGPAIADLIWGTASPSGKLPVTFPKSVGQIPLYYNHANTGRPPRPYDFARDNRVVDSIDLQLGYNSNYIDASPYPLYPFGYGLSYTTFEYGPVELSSTKLRAGESLTVRVPVRNSGEMAADEIVQLYVRDLVGSLVRPVRELKAFRRVHLDVGETISVKFSLAADDLAYFNNQGQCLLEPGKFALYVGGSSLAPRVGEFELGE